MIIQSNYQHVLLFAFCCASLFLILGYDLFLNSFRFNKAFIIRDRVLFVEILTNLINSKITSRTFSALTRPFFIFDFSLLRARSVSFVVIRFICFSLCQ